MKVKIYTGPPGCGKTYKTLKDMLKPKCYLYATSRVDLIDERESDFSRLYKKTTRTPYVVKINSIATRGKVAHEIEEAIENHRGEKHVVVFVTHEGLMGAELDNLKGWNVIIDEIPASLQCGTIDAISSGAVFKERYTLEEVDGTDMSRVHFSGFGSSSRKLRRDDLIKTLANFNKKVKSSAGLYVKLKSWDDLLTRELHWISAWTLDKIETADSITLAGAGFEDSLLLKTSKKLNPHISYKIEKVQSRARANRKIQVMYFTEKHDGSTVFWDKSEGRFCLNKIAVYLSNEKIDFWSGNDVATNYLEHRFQGKLVRPKQEGTNGLSHQSTCAFIYSAKPQISDNILTEIFDISADDIQRARESEDIIQFVCRGSLRSPQSQKTYKIFLYSLDQAEMLEEYLTEHQLGDVEIIPIPEAGIMDFERPKSGRPTKSKTPEEAEAYEAMRRKKDAERKRKKRAEMKASRTTE